MGSRTKLALKLASAFTILTALTACGQDEKPATHSELSAQSCNYSAYESCIVELSLMNSSDRGYLAKKIKCDMIWNRCN
jgi:predicted outer membrane lipoprotein